MTFHKLGEYFTKKKKRVKFLCVNGKTLKENLPLNLNNYTIYNITLCSEVILYIRLTLIIETKTS